MKLATTAIPTASTHGSHFFLSGDAAGCGSRRLAPHKPQKAHPSVVEARQTGHYETTFDPTPVLLSLAMS
jgi:hypothetical protein